MRGVSPVVATILMVAIAIAAAVVAYSWLSGIQQSAQATSAQGAETVGTVPVEIMQVKCAGGTDYDKVKVLLYNPSSTQFSASVSARFKIDAYNIDATIGAQTVTVPAGSTSTLTLTVSDLNSGGKSCDDFAGSTVNLELYTPAGTIPYQGQLQSST